MSERAQPISFLIGRPHGQQTTAVATVIFPRPLWQRDKAVAWLKRNGFKAAPVEALSGSFRAIQHAPRHFTRGTLRTIHTAGHSQPVRANPRVRVSARDFHQAVGLYRKFREAEPKRIAARRFHVPAMMMEIGPIPWLYYFTTHKGGRPVLYKHTFAPNARPMLAASSNGRQLYLLGGSYDFTRDGIVDRER